MYGECEEKETSDIMINRRPCTTTRQDYSVSCESYKIVDGKKSCPWLSICGLFKNLCAKLTKICAQRMFKLSKLKVFASAFQSTFLQ